MKSPYVQVAFILTAAVLILAGCEYDRWTIRMTPAGDTIRREAVVERMGGGRVEAPASQAATQPVESDARKPVPPERIAALEKLYPQRVETDSGAGFAGTFGPTLPDDLGPGRYVRYASELGDAYLYMERFGGDPDQAARIEQAFADVDTLTDRVIAWLGSELGEERNWPEFQKKLDGPLRRTLKNGLLLAWDGQTGLAGEEEDDAPVDILSRIFLQLAEAGLLKTQDIPTLRRMTDDGVSSDAGLAFLRAKIADLLGYESEKEAGDVLAFLADSEAAQESFHRYLRSTPEYRRMLEEWRRGERDEDDEPPEPTDVLSTPAERIFAMFFRLGSADMLALSLKTEVEPFATNGEWSAEDGEVRWERNLPYDEQTPAICFAAWARPDPAAQERYLGSGTLDGAELLNFCTWRSTLSAGRERVYLAALDGLAAGTDKVAWLREQGLLAPAESDDEDPPGAAAVADAIRRAATQPADPD